MHRLHGLAIAVALLAMASSAAAQPAGDPEAYLRHLTAGAALAEEEDCAGAVTELEAAYRIQQTPEPLLAIARCERARSGVPKGILALERALREQGAAMAPAARASAQHELDEMRALLGSVEVRVTPRGATLRLDGEDLPATALTGPIPMGPGSHRLEARLEGYAPAARTITLESGERARLSFDLVPEAKLAAPAPASIRGVYGLAATTVFLPVAPTDFSGTGVGLSVGARAGYRFASFLGAELGFEYAHLGASGQARPSLADDRHGGAHTAYPLAYSLSSFRVGAHLRLMTTGERVRFVQTLGGGVMADSIGWRAEPGGPSIARRGASGVDGFGLSETGIEVDLRGLLLGLTAQQLLGSSGGLSAAKADKFPAATYGGPQYGAGIGLRAGYRGW